MLILKIIRLLNSLSGTHWMLTGWSFWNFLRKKNFFIDTLFVLVWVFVIFCLVLFGIEGPHGLHRITTNILRPMPTFSHQTGTESNRKCEKHLGVFTLLQRFGAEFTITSTLQLPCAWWSRKIHECNWNLGYSLIYLLEHHGNIT